MVNILLIDNDIATVQFMQILSQNEKELNVIQTFDFNDAMQKYTNNVIDFVIVDYSNSVYEKIYKEILTIDPKQKIIIISSKVEDCNHLKCEICINHFNQKRLIKPFDPKDLRAILMNFKDSICKYYKRFENIETIMGEIIKRYVGCIYDKNTKIVSFLHSDYMTTDAMVDLSNILNEHNMSYRILDNLNIQIGEMIVKKDFHTA